MNRASGTLTSALGAGGFSIVAGSDHCQGTTLASGAQCTLQAQFAPPPDSGSMAMLSMSATPGGSATAMLSANGLTTGQLFLAPDSFNFSTVPVGSSATKTSTVTNMGGGATGVLATSLVPAALGMSILADTCKGSTLQGMASCTLQVQFQPTSYRCTHGHADRSGGHGEQLRRLDRGRLQRHRGDLHRDPERGDHGQRDLHAPAVYAGRCPLLAGLRKGDALAAEVGRRHGAPVAMMHLNQGIFDDASISVITSATAGEICRLAGRSADVRRFRPNIVVRSTRAVPFEEDEWLGGVLTFGDADDAPAVAVTSRDARCVMVNFDPDGGSPGPKVLKAVVRANQNLAGVYGTVTRSGRLAVGQTIALER